MAIESQLAQQLRQRNLAFVDPSIDYAAITSPPMVKRKPAGLRQIKAEGVQIYKWPEFLNGEVCSHLCRIIDKNVRPSTVASDQLGGPAETRHANRTSHSCDLDFSIDPLVKKTDALIARAIGFGLSHSDRIQAQRYEVGQEFKPHHDYFEPGTPSFDNFCSEKGQRTWTFMIYLNNVEKGGATVFPALNKTFKPNLGMALIWNNLLPDGRVNATTFHGGAPVKAGTKYIITKWFRERGAGTLYAPEQA